jgi:hypothetical protein
VILTVIQSCLPIQMDQQIEIGSLNISK